MFKVSLWWVFEGGWVIFEEVVHLGEVVVIIESVQTVTVERVLVVGALSVGIDVVGEGTFGI